MCNLQGWPGTVQFQYLYKVNTRKIINDLLKKKKKDLGKCIKAKAFSYVHSEVKPIFYLKQPFIFCGNWKPKSGIKKSWVSLLWDRKLSIKG